jgi:NAD(P)-dependent dehydrogenase (short-subunit alcohol dehydrogenase family)
MSEPTMRELFDLTGRVALITGGTGHLGGAMARGLAEAGATVVIASRDEARARAAAEELPAGTGVPHYGVELDQKDESSLERGFARAVELAGGIDILVNNGQSGPADDLSTVTAEQFADQLQNATGYFLLARLFRDHVVGRGVPGSVVMIGSMYGVVGSYPDAYLGVSPANPVSYQTLKGGVIQMTRHLAVYWGRDNVRVNCLSPGPFPSDQAPPALVERLKAKLPMGRMGRPHELKGAVVFLASDASSFLTGQNLTIDGGWTAW